ncbi:hypothetical protein OQX61_01995 [Pedobacter sp. PLR]|uniref:hypothetical protein n=1 Tax=Pedobacter sp. PLR TaxID=2994465 RepID=UPI0022476138|nr:hypothetical protein [Pedobacter sp. PLR]MCX2450030.1 hypothetical protein [Pedobacter sp. PLR]
MKDNYSMNVSLQCVTCGNTGAFDFNEDKTYVKCTACNREYLNGYAELVELNQENINNVLEEKKSEIAQDFKNDILKAFKGNKYIKIK